MFAPTLLCGDHFMVPTSGRYRVSDLRCVPTLESTLINWKGEKKERRREGKSYFKA